MPSFRLRAGSGGGCAGSCNGSTRCLPVSPLDQLSLRVTVSESKTKHEHEQYSLYVQPRSNGDDEWCLRRSFDEYVAFQQQLLQALRHGHLCDAECPWLFSVLSGYFPKRAWLSTSRSRAQRKREQALERCLLQIHAFVKNHRNDSCPCAVAVRELFTAFVVDEDHSTDLLAKQGSWRDSVSSTSSSSLSLGLPEEDTTTKSCGLCNKVLCDEDVGATGVKRCYYTTVLRCGHEFHDECILSKLNESMQCPVCGQQEGCL